MIHVRHILVKHQYEIDDIQRKLDEGISFEDLAKLFSQCPSSRKGGDLGAIREGQTVEEFEDTAFTLEVGETSKPVRTSFGYHLIQRIK
jgi:peptidyl-prolyl cis-trans isomerase C